MHKQERRQGARNKENVIEPRMKKNNVAMRLYQPAISGIQPAADEKKRIKNVSEPPHNNARIMRPNPKPSRTFNSRILVKITPENLVHLPRPVKEESASIRLSFGAGDVPDGTVLAGRVHPLMDQKQCIATGRNFAGHFLNLNFSSGHARNPFT
jgi:hypothetical protein